MTNPQPIDFTGIAGTFYLFFLQKSGYNMLSLLCQEEFLKKHVGISHL